MSINNVEIVVARYNEDLSWILESPFNEFQFTIYNKGPNDNFCKTNVKKVVNIPNVGRCDHTYLYHIINNYNDLSLVTVFLPGSTQIPHKKTKAIEILNRIKNCNYKNAIFIGSYSKNILDEFKAFHLEKYTCSDSQNLQINQESILKLSILRPFSKWYSYHFGDTHVNYYSFNSIFSIHKNDITQHDISRYEKLIYGLKLHSNPEVGHYCERAWGTIFHPLKYTKVLIT